MVAVPKMTWIIVLLCVVAGLAAAEKSVRFETEKGALRVFAGEKLFARYVYEDPLIRRPYFCDVHAPDGTQVTRSNPPIEGTDSTDHADMHPGIWMAFGDINGEDFWRNKGTVKQTGFVQEPAAQGHRGAFAVKLLYLASDGREIARETARYSIVAQDGGTLLMMDAAFEAIGTSLIFGDQEEMGLGVRVATPMTVKRGGVILNSDGLKNEAGAWGKAAAWCAYQGSNNGAVAGVCLMPHPETFRKSWFHARDYGLLVANAFGRNAFTNGEKSAVVVKPGEPFSLRFGVWIYAGSDRPLSEAYAAYIAASAISPPGR